MSSEKKDEMTKRIAVFKHAKHEWLVTFDRDEGDDSSPDEYCRVSEFQTVTFVPLSDKEIVGTQLTALAQLRAQTVDEFAEKLRDIDGRMANLRALTGPETSNETP